MGIYGTADELVDRGETIALVTVTAIEGSAPRQPGTSMIVHADGSITGTIGGGNVEDLSREAALEAIESGEPRHEQYELRPQGNTGMVCDGYMEVFINVLEGRRRLIIAGGGHIAVPTARIADAVGYRPVVIEDRDEFADEERFPAARVIHGTIEEGFDTTAVTENTAVVIATRSSALDRRAAEAALESDAFYVGCVASQSKAAHIREGLGEEGVDPAAIERLHSPVGLDTGADSPGEIALSILAEIEAVRTGTDATPLSDASYREDPPVDVRE